MRAVAAAAAARRASAASPESRGAAAFIEGQKHVEHAAAAAGSVARNYVLLHRAQKIALTLSALKWACFDSHRALVSINRGNLICGMHTAMLPFIEKVCNGNGRNHRAYV